MSISSGILYAWGLSKSEDINWHDMMSVEQSFVTSLDSNLVLPVKIKCCTVWYHLYCDFQTTVGVEALTSAGNPTSVL